MRFNPSGMDTALALPNKGGATKLVAGPTQDPTSSSYVYGLLDQVPVLYAILKGKAPSGSIYVTVEGYNGMIPAVSQASNLKAWTAIDAVMHGKAPPSSGYSPVPPLDPGAQAASDAAAGGGTGSGFPVWAIPVAGAAVLAIGGLVWWQWPTISHALGNPKVRSLKDMKSDEEFYEREIVRWSKPGGIHAPESKQEMLEQRQAQLEQVRAELAALGPQTSKPRRRKK